jgi:hypothetical protein
MYRRTFLQMLGLAAAGCAISPTLVFASEGGKNADRMVLTSDGAVDMAQRFADDCYPGEGLLATNPIKLTEATGQPIGYICDYAKNGQPYGYLIVDVTAPMGIAEYSIGSDARSPYARAIQVGSDQVAPFSLDDEPTALRLDPLTYGVVSQASGTMFLNDGTEQTPPPALYSAWGDATIGITDFYSNYTIALAGNLPTWISITQDRVIELTGHYACAVTAYYNIAGIYGLIDTWQAGSDYMSIWDYTGTVVDTSNTDPSAIWGTSNMAKSGDEGFKNYCASKGKSISYQRDPNPTFSQFVLAVNGKRPSILRAQSYGGAGHAVVVEGYFQASRKSDGASFSVLQIADGWYSGVRYVNYNHSGLTDKASHLYY